MSETLEFSFICICLICFLLNVTRVFGMSITCCRSEFVIVVAAAPVSRIVKYFRNDGTPLLTVGGYVFDFVKRKATCDDEYHLLVRTGLLSYQAVSEFMVDVMVQ